MVANLWPFKVLHDFSWILSMSITGAVAYIVDVTQMPTCKNFDIPGPWRCGFIEFLPDAIS